MQDEGSELLSEHSNQKGRHSATRATNRCNEGEGRDLHLSGDEARKEIRCRRIDWTEEEAR